MFLNLIPEYKCFFLSYIRFSYINSLDNFIPRINQLLVCSAEQMRNLVVIRDVFFINMVLFQSITKCCWFYSPHITLISQLLIISTAIISAGDRIISTVTMSCAFMLTLVQSSYYIADSMTFSVPLPITTLKSFHGFFFFFSHDFLFSGNNPKALKMAKGQACDCCLSLQTHCSPPPVQVLLYIIAILCTTVGSVHILFLCLTLYLLFS